MIVGSCLSREMDNKVGVWRCSAKLGPNMQRSKWLILGEKEAKTPVANERWPTWWPWWCRVGWCPKPKKSMNYLLAAWLQSTSFWLMLGYHFLQAIACDVCWGHCDVCWRKYRMYFLNAFGDRCLFICAKKKWTREPSTAPAATRGWCCCAWRHRHNGWDIHELPQTSPGRRQLANKKWDTSTSQSKKKRCFFDFFETLIFLNNTNKHI